MEVHISNIYKREEFRHNSFTAPVCDAVISGLGVEGYMGRFAVSRKKILIAETIIAKSPRAAQSLPHRFLK